jgi:hypothetical protein
VTDLPDLLHHEREVRGERVVHRFANGLAVETDRPLEARPDRILSLGGPQRALMNHLLGFPEAVRGRRGFEPFAGSGALGLMALAVGAVHVDFLDVNPRAVAFQRENAARNGFGADRFDAIEGDVADHAPARPYDWILANPPFVPTPEGIAGTLTSNGGPDGSRLVGLLLDRLDALLAPAGRALVYVFQLVKDGRPLIAAHAERVLPRRPVALVPAQERPAALSVYAAAYDRLFPDAGDAIARWRDGLERRHGAGLGVAHYVVDVGPEGSGPPGCALREDFAARFGGAFFVPAAQVDELALGRAFENLVPASSAAPGAGGSPGA